MNWYEYYSKEKVKNFDAVDLVEIFDEVLEESLSPSQRALLTDDFFNNTLKEMFSGIDYSKITRKSHNFNNTYQFIKL